MTDVRDPADGSPDTQPHQPDPAADGEGVAPGPPQRLYFHVGLPKSGSTYLQAVLGNHRTALKDVGYLYPYVRQEGMFLAAVEMAGSARRWGLDRDDISGTFAHLLRRSRRLGGHAVLSHEIFGWAGPEQIAAMAEQLADFEVHVVVTVRDLGRTITAEWQEQVKNGHLRSFAEFSDALMADLESGERPAFWRSQNVVELLERWSALAPPERIHVVTCPRRGEPPELIWHRFADAIELPRDALPLDDVPERNVSLGIAQIALLRRVLAALDHRLEQPWHSRIAKRWFAQTLLSRAPSPKPVAPPALVERLTPLAGQWADTLAARGYQVHGDLAELLPEPGDPDAPHPDDATETDQLAGLPEVLAEMLLRTRDLHLRIGELEERLADTEQARDELREEVARLSVPPPTFGERVRGRLRRIRSAAG